MRVSFVFHVAALALAFLAIGCGGGNGPKEMIAGLNQGISAMRDIQDEASAKAAAPKLKAAAEKYHAGLNKLDKDKPTEDQIKEIQELQTQVGKEQMRLAAVPGGPAAIADFTKTTQEGNMKLLKK
jgi:hypothetical protein